MGSVPVNTGGGGGGGRAVAELNYHMRYEHKEVRDGVVGEGQGLSEEDESKINEVGEDGNTGVGREMVVGRSHSSLQRPQAQVHNHQHQRQLSGSGSVVRWERFLPLRSLKVLLVENDDSTRHVVSALLRNCSYEVVAVSNGVQAWKILQNLTNRIDIILTEVVMPCVSGIGLLCKIMNHKSCKNIPVIMMSSHDSMGIVFKCLSKGAVDFLVKPIRKNELKNLWQHVWRRCHSSSGSGSESGIQTRNSVRSKSIDYSDNNSGSNDEDGDDSVGLNVRDGSDNGSGTQSSWTKRAVEVDSPQPTSPWDKSDPPNSTCAQVIHPKSESFGKEWMPSAQKEPSENEPLDNVQMGKDLEIGVPRNADLQQENQREKVCAMLIGPPKSKTPESGPEEDNVQLTKEPLGFDSQNASGEPRAQNTDQIGLTTNSNLERVEFGFSDTHNGNPKGIDLKDQSTPEVKELPSLELSLKRLRDVGGTSNDDRNVLRRSDASAFSRYNTAYNNVSQTPTGMVGSNSPPDNISDAMKTDSVYNQRSNESSNNYDMGSTNKNIFSNPAAVKENSVATSAERCVHPSAFQPVPNDHVCPPLQTIPQKVNDAVAKAVAAQTRGANQQVQVQHHHHYHHHHHHHVHNMKKQQQGVPDPEDLSLSMGGAAVQCESSNMVVGTAGGASGNYSLNGSASGSNHGSSKQNGTSNNLIGGTNIEGENGVAGTSGVGASGSGSGSGVDQNHNQNRSAQRVAALTKFRQKRKERCFERKVRYQSRKRLAEQRPRVRGQFVRQRVYENNGEGDC